MKPFDLVIFDCDGVLVDSELIGNEVLATVLANYGVCIDPSVARSQYEGQSVGEIRRRVEEAFGFTMPNDWTDQYYALLIQALRERARPIKGVRDIIGYLRHKSIPICVASQGPIAKIEASLKSAGLWDDFVGRAYSAKSVSQPKPAPDLFLHAARSLDIAPERCAVIEDSATGVAAGRAAGMAVFAYCPAEEKAAPMRRLGAIPFQAMIELSNLLVGA